MSALSNKARIFWPLLGTVLLADCTSKRAAVETLIPGAPREVVGAVVRFSLSYNDGAAMGLPMGPHAREILGIFSLFIVAFLFALYVRARPRQLLLSAALGLLIAGALGNAFERLFSGRGVVDFIDVGLGITRFYTFNVADVAVSIGAILMLITGFAASSDPSEPAPGADAHDLVVPSAPPREESNS